MIYGNVPEFLISKSVQQDLSAPYAHHQNVVERHVQTIVKATAACLHEQVLLGPSFWDYALFHIVSLKNNTPNSKTDGISPKAIVEGTKGIDLNRVLLYPFGTPVAVKLPKRTWLFDVKNEMGIYLGQPEGTLYGGLIYYPSTVAIVTRSDLVELKIRPSDFSRYANVRNSDKSNNSMTVDSEQTAFEIDISSQRESGAANPNTETIATTTPVNVEKESIPFRMSKRKLKRILQDIRINTRSKKKILGLADCLLTKVNELQSALNSMERKEWVDALRLEVDSLLFKTETLVPEIPNPDVPYDVIYASIVLKKKMIDEQRVDKYKVRIVGCGNQLLNKATYVNETETFSPTVAMLVHLALLLLSIFDRMHMATFDTTAAYLQQNYPPVLKPLYIKFPATLARALDLNPDVLYRVKKYIYGLPDAGRAYYLSLTEHLQSNGYKNLLLTHVYFLRYLMVPAPMSRRMWTMLL